MRRWQLPQPLRQWRATEVRRDLSWALGASVLLSIAALFGNQVPRVVSAIEPRLREQTQALDALSIPDRAGATASGALPTRLTRLTIEPARRDPFVPATSAPAPTVAPVPAVIAAAPATPPVPPPINVRFLGRMVTPDGQRLSYLVRGEVAIAVKVGDRLDEGYVVESVGEEAVGLVYPPLNAHVTVPIPPAPKQ